MGKLTSWVERNKDRLWFSVLINAAVLALLMLVFFPAYETNDDMGLMTFFSGIKGVHDYHSIYLHCLYGILLSGLFSLNQNVPWYAIVQYTLLFFSFTSVTWVMIRRMKHSSSIWIYLCFLSVFAYEGYVKVQYTKSAGIMAASGLLLLFYALFQEEIPKGPYAAGMFLAVSGAFWRVTQFMAELGLFVALGVYFLFWLRTMEKGQRLKRFLTCAGTFVLLLAVVAVGWKADRLTYSAEGWSWYLEYNEARVELQDYGYPDYQENEEAYNALGIDATANQLYRKWTNSDSEKFTLEVMRSLAELKPEKKINRALLKSFLKTIPAGLLTNNGFRCFALLALIWLLRGRRGVPEVVTVLFEGGMLTLLYLYLFYQGRYLYNRVDIGLWMAGALIVLWVTNPEKKVLPGKASLPVFLVMLIAMQSVWQVNWRVNRERKRSSMAAEKEVLETIDADSEHLYLTKIGTVSFANAYEVWDAVPFGIGDNLYPLGGWTAQSVTYLAVLDNYGVSNPFRDMIDNDKVYLIDDDIELTVEYLQDWYAEDAEAVQVNTIGKYAVYQIRTTG